MNGGRSAAEPGAVSFARRAWLSPVLFGAIVVVAFLAFAASGRASESRGDRVLGAFSPVFSALDRGGRAFLEWTWSHPKAIGWIVTGAGLALGVLGVLAARLQAWPLLLLFAGLMLATWGQITLSREGLTRVGVFLYLAGVLCAAALGRARPLSRLPGFPVLPSPEDPASPPRHGRSALPRWEWLAVLAFTLLGLLLRGYELTERPAAFDGEMTSVMLGSYTPHGIAYYMKTELLGTGAGIFHVLTHYVFYRLFGASIFTIRIVAVFWGVLAIPLLYWLARRIAGRWAAMAATLLFLAAPEQLFWSRNDNTHFAPVLVLALVTAHLGLSMQERFAPRAVAAAALGMPLSRYSYTPSFVLFTMPLLLAAHGAVFVRGVLRRLRYVAPMLLAGLLLWIFSLSVVEFALEPGRGWHFIHPARIKGEVAWRYAIGEGAGPLEILRAQSVRVVRNAGYVLAGMTYGAKYTSHWYTRFVLDRITLISAGLAVLCALGIGYLLGQIQERRAALLLIWIAIGLLPGCMSDEPEARRISIIFPALPIVAAVFVTAAGGIAARVARLWTARAAMAGLGVAVVLTAFAGLVSNLLLTAAPLELEAQMRFARPLFERCDMVLHNDLGTNHEIAEIGILDAYVGNHGSGCSQLVQEKDWPAAALKPHCDFTDLAFVLTLSPEEREERRRRYRPARIGYLLMETRESRAHIELLRRLFPTARTEEFREATSANAFFAMEVPLSMIEALRAPELSPESAEAARRAQSGLLEGVRLAVASQPAPTTTIQGGLLLPETNWYRFDLEPPCPGAELTVGTPPSGPQDVRPLAAGIHAFTIRFRKPSTCRLPLKLRIESVRDSATAVSPVFLAPSVVSAAPAPPVIVTPGYGESSVFARLTDPPADIGVDGKGEIFVLSRGPGGWTVRRFGSAGKQEAVFQTSLPLREAHAVLSVDADGNCVLSSSSLVEVRDRSGNILQSWQITKDRPPSDAAFLPDGRIAFCFPNRDSVDVYTRDGRFEGPLTLPEGHFVAPAGVAVAADGTIAVVEEDGFVHVLRAPSGRQPAKEVSSFRVAYPEIPYPPDLAACAFDGSDRILFPHRSLAVPLLYDLKGRLALASTSQSDLSGKGLVQSRGVCSTRDALYVLELSPPSVLRIARQ